MAVVPRSTIDSKGTAISYLDFGGMGQLIVLLHGLAGGASEWAETAIALTGRGHVIAPDLRGQGHSDRLLRDVSRGFSSKVLEQPAAPFRFDGVFPTVCHMNYYTGQGFHEGGRACFPTIAAARHSFWASAESVTFRPAETAP